MLKRFGMKGSWCMSASPERIELAHLEAHIMKHLVLLSDTATEIKLALKEDLPKLGKTPRAAVMIAGLIENYYTCAETIFVRISQYFENHLPADRWHRELLDRMRLEIQAMRPCVLSDAVFEDLLELMCFRHFKRYYFGTAYDWERIDALLIRVERLVVKLPAELQTFLCFIKALNQE